MKGKETPTRVFEPLSMVNWRANRREERKTKWQGKQVADETLTRSDELEQANRLSRDFAQAQELYRGRQFGKLMELLEPYARDPAAAALRERARAMRDKPPPDDWDGVEVLTEK